MHLQTFTSGQYNTDYDFLLETPVLRQRSMPGGTMPLTEFAIYFFNIIKAQENKQIATKDVRNTVTNTTTIEKQIQVGGFLEGIEELMKESFFIQRQEEVKVQSNQLDQKLQPLTQYQRGTSDYLAKFKSIVETLNFPESAALLTRCGSTSDEYPIVFAQLSKVRNQPTENKQPVFGVMSPVIVRKNKERYDRMIKDLFKVYGAILAAEHSEHGENSTSKKIDQLTEEKIHPLAPAIGAYRGFINSARVSKKIKALDARIGGYKDLLGSLQKNIPTLVQAQKRLQLEDIKTTSVINLNENNYNDTIDSFIRNGLASACSGSLNIQPAALRKVLGDALGYITWLKQQITEEAGKCKELASALQFYQQAIDAFNATGISVEETPKAFVGNKVIAQNQQRLDKTLKETRVNSYIVYPKLKEGKYEDGELNTPVSKLKPEDVAINSLLVFTELQDLAQSLETSFATVEEGISGIETIVAEFRHGRGDVHGETLVSSSTTNPPLRRGSTLPPSRSSVSRPLEVKEALGSKAAKIFFFGDEIFKFLAQHCRGHNLGTGNIDAYVKTTAQEAWKTHQQEKGYTQLSDFVALGKLLSDENANLDNIKEDTLFEIYKLRFYLLQELSNCFFQAQFDYEKVKRQPQDADLCWLISKHGFPDEQAFARGKNIMVDLTNEGDPNWQHVYIRPVISLMWTYINYVVKVKALVQKMRSNTQCQGVTDEEILATKNQITPLMEEVIQQLALLDQCINDVWSVLSQVTEQSEVAREFSETLNKMQVEIAKFPNLLDKAPPTFRFLQNENINTLFKSLKLKWQEYRGKAKGTLDRLLPFTRRIPQSSSMSSSSTMSSSRSGSTSAYQQQMSSSSSYSFSSTESSVDNLNNTPPPPPFSSSISQQSANSSSSENKSPTNSGTNSNSSSTLQSSTVEPLKLNLPVPLKRIIPTQHTGQQNSAPNASTTNNELKNQSQEQPKDSSSSSTASQSETADSSTSKSSSFSSFSMGSNDENDIPPPPPPLTDSASISSSNPSVSTGYSTQSSTASESKSSGNTFSDGKPNASQLFADINKGNLMSALKSTKNLQTQKKAPKQLQPTAYRGKKWLVEGVEQKVEQNANEAINSSSSSSSSSASAPQINLFNILKSSLPPRPTMEGNPIDLTQHDKDYDPQNDNENENKEETEANKRKESWDETDSDPNDESRRKDSESIERSVEAAIKRTKNSSGTSNSYPSNIDRSNPNKDAIRNLVIAANQGNTVASGSSNKGSRTPPPNSRSSAYSAASSTK